VVIVRHVSLPQFRRAGDRSRYKLDRHAPSRRYRNLSNQPGIASNRCRPNCSHANTGALLGNLTVEVARRRSGSDFSTAQRLRLKYLLPAKGRRLVPLLLDQLFFGPGSLTQFLGSFLVKICHANLPLLEAGLRQPNCATSSRHLRPIVYMETTDLRVLQKGLPREFSTISCGW
jgi:hypothetical protein